MNKLNNVDINNVRTINKNNYESWKDFRKQNWPEKGWEVIRSMTFERARKIIKKSEIE